MPRAQPARPSARPNKPRATRYADLPARRCGRPTLVALHRAQMLDELVDGFAYRALRVHVAALLDPKLVAPHRHRPRAVRTHVDAAAVDDVAYPLGGKLAVAHGYRRAIRHLNVQRRSYGTVAARLASVTARAK